MAINLQQLQELELSELPWWPAPLRRLVFAITAVVVLGAGYYFLLADDWRSYQQDVTKERTLKDEYQLKYYRTANLPTYREQLVVLNAALADLLNMLPTDDETPRLLDDITLIGTQSGLRIERIEWQAAVQRELYTALPMRIELTGEYHQIGDFIAELAGLDRIISVQDFQLLRASENAPLRLTVTAETYRQQTMRAEP